MNDFKQFTLVNEIARYGSISKAAKSLGIAQPTLSKYLNRLESELGTELFNRSVIPLKLTTAGEKYLIAGNRILDIHHQLNNDLKKIILESDDVVKIGISPTRAHYLLPNIIKEFKKINQTTKVVVRELNTSQLVSELSRGDLDLVISFNLESAGEFDRISLFSEKIILAVPKKYKDLSADDILKQCPFISIGSGLKMSNILKKILFDVGANEPIIEAQSIELALSLVNGGFGVSLAPSYVEKYGKYDNITFFQLPKAIQKRYCKDIERNVCVMFRQESNLKSSDKDFIKACEKVFNADSI